jgi:hypothetical protein
MNYRNTEMKIDQILNYFNDGKINLSPAFQRGHVWATGVRRKLLENIVQGKPIPAIFLYKEASGSRYSYNILDGKQRLESLILFVGNNRNDLAVRNWADYFFDANLRKNVGFWIQLPQGKIPFAKLEAEVVRDFREYAIPTVEISLSDDTHLDEIINLFVDINQQGVQVSRFDIVKAMAKDAKLLKATFKLIAIQQRRGQDIFYKAMKNDYTRVLKRLSIISKVSDSKSQVDRMWERLLEIALFSKTRQHRKSVDILKSFISSGDTSKVTLTPSEVRSLKKVFSFLAKAYKNSSLGDTQLAVEQTYFYTMITSLIDSDLLSKYSPEELIPRLVRFARSLSAPGKPSKQLKKFIELSSDRTTDTPRRDERQKQFVALVASP